MKIAPCPRVKYDRLTCRQVIFLVIVTRKTTKTEHRISSTRDGWRGQGVTNNNINIIILLLCLDEQFVERLVRVGRDGYGNGGQLEPFDVPLLDGGRAGCTDAASGGTDAATDGRADAATAGRATDRGTGAHATTGTDAAAATAAAAAATGEQRQRERLAVGPAAVVVLGQEVGAAGLPYGPHRYAVADMRVLVNGTDVNGRVDPGSGAQQVPGAPVQRIGQAAPH